jgi:DNA polymerase IV
MPSQRSKAFPDSMIFHLDMDAFYASVEQLENPYMRGKPVIVGGVDSLRGVVSTCSYEARVFGVHSAMSVVEARRRCPQGIFVSGRHHVYADYSRRLMDCLSEYSPVIEQISVDEAFLDMTGTEKLFGAAEESGLKLKSAIYDRLGLTASVGVAENKFLAKLASDINKPNGLKVVKVGEAQAFLDPMKVDRLWGVGKKTVLQLHQVGFYSIEQIRLGSLPVLIAHFGESFAQHIFDLAHGRDDRELVTESQEKSISHEQTFEVDTAETDLLIAALLDMSERVARRARKDGLAGRTIAFVWRNPDFSRQSHGRSLASPTNSSQEIFSVAKELFLQTANATSQKRSGGFVKRAKDIDQVARKFRLIGVRLSNFTMESEQLSLFEDPKPITNLDIAMDAVRNKFGEGAIRRARLADLDLEN